MKQRSNKGQALVELLLVVPILFFMIIFGFQIFKSIYSADVQQEKARTKLLLSPTEGIYFKANGGSQLPYTVVREQSKGIETSGIPILSGSGTSTIDIKMGMCREPKGVCSPN